MDRGEGGRGKKKDLTLPSFNSDKGKKSEVMPPGPVHLSDMERENHLTVKKPAHYPEKALLFNEGRGKHLVLPLIPVNVKKGARSSFSYLTEKEGGKAGAGRFWREREKKRVTERGGQQVSLPMRKEKKKRSASLLFQGGKRKSPSTGLLFFVTVTKRERGGKRKRTTRTSPYACFEKREEKMEKLDRGETLQPLSLRRKNQKGGKRAVGPAENARC